MRQSVHPRDKQMDDISECRMTRFSCIIGPFRFVLFQLTACHSSTKNKPFILTAFKAVAICISLKCENEYM